MRCKVSCCDSKSRNSDESDGSRSRNKSSYHIRVLKVFIGASALAGLILGAVSLSIIAELKGEIDALKPSTPPSPTPAPWDPTTPSPWSPTTTPSPWSPTTTPSPARESCVSWDGQPVDVINNNEADILSGFTVKGKIEKISITITELDGFVGEDNKILYKEKFLSLEQFNAAKKEAVGLPLMSSDEPDVSVLFNCSSTDGVNTAKNVTVPLTNPATVPLTNPATVESDASTERSLRGGI